MDRAKFIFVTGGVLSSLGKGISSSSIATLLQHCNYQVSILKIDPYINIDPGTMSPLEHGEVFVTSDGAETDLDIGHYERFLNKNLTRLNNFTTGQIFSSVIDNERKGKYLGKTIQIVPHVTDEIKQRIKNVAKGCDFLIVEVGGTVGDMEGMFYLEAIRQLKLELGSERVINVHVTLIPYIQTTNELKTKPTQHSVQELRRLGVTPQIILARSPKPLDKELKKKIALSCDVEQDSVIVATDAKSIYACPIHFLQEGILTPIARRFNLNKLHPKMAAWNTLVEKIIAPKHKVKIGFVGKYLSLKESYKSLIEALTHAGAHLDTHVEIKWLDSEDFNDETNLDEIDAILVPGGFGERGVLGKMCAIKRARLEKLPFLGICLGMQLAIIEFSRHVLGLKEANSTEFDKNCKTPVVYLIEDFIDQNNHKQVRTYNSPLGGTMRLGEYECKIAPNSKLENAYKKSCVKERHRHRYEVNPIYRNEWESQGLKVVGIGANNLIEAVELDNHPFFVGVQFHPEFTSRLQSPNPIILDFIKHALNKS
ncbi:glutamine hydrolyzing CTP synthase [Helicobacter cetorum]|uniref:glutamine hydrolyzing CTP synthase n=1 Tax=Helicobacter cetorum TaxID=138563 RepID=UPI000CF07B7D|nr:CTP synthase (glutamine hydrolyzing) [Helicobacter cetorum]